MQQLLQIEEIVAKSKILHQVKKYPEWWSKAIIAILNKSLTWTGMLEHETDEIYLEYLTFKFAWFSLTGIHLIKMNTTYLYWSTFFNCSCQIWENKKIYNLRLIHRPLFTKFLTPWLCILFDDWLKSVSPANHRADYVICGLARE